MTNDLYNYAPFFEWIVLKVFNVCIDENIFICELRHIFGFVFDDERKSIKVRGELEIFDKCVKEIQVKYPLF